MRRYTILLFLAFSLVSQAQYSDWPMWRYDAGRSASSPEQLPEKLFLQWEAIYSPRIPVWDDPLNQNLMQFDRIFEPVAADGKLFIGFNDQDKVVALDLETGKELWHFYADGPVRLPLAAYQGNIFFTGDDGCCYCLNGSTGVLKWKVMLAPLDNKLLGNQRLISMWPARGGIVIKDGLIYTAASIFPMMGTYIYALDAISGKVVWKNEGTGSNYILQPHKSPAFADVAPQGPFVITGNKLLVAGGRSVPAAFNTTDGRELYYKLAESGKTGGAFTCAGDGFFFNHHRDRMTVMYDAETGTKIGGEAGEYPVIDKDTVYFSGKKVSASVIGRDKKPVSLWATEVSAANDLIKAGNCLYAADSTGITAIRLKKGEKPQVIWHVKSEKRIERLIASRGKLVAVTSDGSIMVYGDKPAAQTRIIKQDLISADLRSDEAHEILSTTGITEGFAIVLGAANTELLAGLVKGSSLSVIALDSDDELIRKQREYFDKSDVKAGRLSFVKFSDDPLYLPKYFASLTVISERKWSDEVTQKGLTSLFESTRPYGGKIWIKTSDRRKLRIVQEAANALSAEGAVAVTDERHVILTREGALKGSAEWTHAYGNIANTIKSEDELVKAPLGILWFGGNSNLDVLPRHGHGPSEQVMDGRLFIEGINSISARDVYTGRLIWKRTFENLDNDNWLVYYDETYDEENPLDPKYNQVHIPGANARGTNFIVTKEYVYVLEGNKCHLLDILNGEIVKTFTGDEKTTRFAYIGVYKDLLILGNNFSDYPDIKAPAEDATAAKSSEEGASNKFDAYDITASRELIVMNRFTGSRLWSIPAKHGFIHNSIIAGDDMMFCLDKYPQSLETRLRRRGEAVPSGSRLLYISIKDGKILHEETNNVFGSWLSYSAEYKYLLQATRASRDMLNGDDGKRMIVYNVVNKEIVWDKAVNYLNPPIIHNDRIITNGEGFSLMTGDPLMEADMITGEETRWGFKREYGCGYVIASENLLTFRSASAAFINLDSFEGTASLGGFKAGCSANLIVADGVLNSPDYTRTCQCSYQNQTSLAFISMPWMSYWTNSNYKWNGSRIKKLGLNINAPGDRVSGSDVLWLDFPNAGGADAGIAVKLDTSGYFTIRKEPVSVKQDGTPWVSSSAAGGIRSLEIPLCSEKNSKEESYTVTLYFSELAGAAPGDRLFDVEIQDLKMIDNLDIVKEAGENDKEITRSFKGIKATNTMKIEFVPDKGIPLISGVEIRMEEKPVN